PPLPPPPASTLFPYTTLFRSLHVPAGDRHADRVLERDGDDGGRRPVRDRGDRAVGDRRARGGWDLLQVDHVRRGRERPDPEREQDRKSTRLNSSHLGNSYAVF